MGKSCAIDLSVADSNPAGQLLIYFHNIFPVLTKTLSRYSSLVSRSRIKAFVRKPRRCSPRPLAPLAISVDGCAFFHLKQCEKIQAGCLNE